MVCTSAPLPPTTPPPAFGAFFVTASCFVAIFGVARTRGLGGAFVFARLFTIFVSFAAALGGAFVGTAGAGASVTTPTARSPGGAAMSWTLYIGGMDTPETWCSSRRGRMIAACSTADAPMGPASERGARRAAIISDRDLVHRRHGLARDLVQQQERQNDRRVQHRRCADGPGERAGRAARSDHFTTSSGSVTNPRLVTPAAWMIASTWATVP